MAPEVTALRTAGANAVRSRVFTVLITVITALAIAVGISVATPSAAQAATVQPTVTNFKFTDSDGNDVTSVAEGVPYKIAFDFVLPNGTRPGDTFVITLPKDFQGSGTTILIWDSTAVADGNQITFTVGKSLDRQVNIAGCRLATKFITPKPTVVFHSDMTLAATPLWRGILRSIL